MGVFFYLRNAVNRVIIFILILSEIYISFFLRRNVCQLLQRSNSLEIPKLQWKNSVKLLEIRMFYVCTCLEKCLNYAQNITSRSTFIIGFFQFRLLHSPSFNLSAANNWSP